MKWAEHRRQRDEEERQSRVMVITEFDAGDPEATMHAMADEILKYRRAVRLLAKADRLGRRRRTIRDHPSRSLLASEAYH